MYTLLIKAQRTWNVYSNNGAALKTTASHPTKSNAECMRTAKLRRDWSEPIASNALNQGTFQNNNNNTKFFKPCTHTQWALIHAERGNEIQPAAEIRMLHDGKYRYREGKPNRTTTTDTVMYIQHGQIWFRCVSLSLHLSAPSPLSLYRSIAG